MTTISSTDGTPLRVGTFNVRWDAPDDGDQRWAHRRSRWIALLRDWSPDLLGLQEPLEYQVRDILDGLPEYGMVGVGRDDGQAAGEFCPILYRRDRFSVAESGTFWLSETPETPGSRGWGSRHARLCTWVALTDGAAGNRLFRLYNLHLDHESQQAREQGVRLLRERLPGRTDAEPVLVTGDFNAGPDNPAVAALSASGAPSLMDVFRIRHGSLTGGGTFHGFTGQAGEAPIDYIFASREWRVLEAAVRHGDGQRPFPSDHFPVSATLAWS